MYDSVAVQRILSIKLDIGRYLLGYEFLMIVTSVC